jgi:hypothetical protein
LDVCCKLPTSSFLSLEIPRKNLYQNGGCNLEDFSSNKLMIIFLS